MPIAESLRLWGVEKKTGARQTRLRFLEFGDVQRGDVEASRFDVGASAGKRGGKNDGFAEGESVCGMRFGGVDINPFERGKRRRIEPGAIGEQRVASKMGDSGFQVKASGDGNADHIVFKWRQDRRKLTNALRVGTLGEADEKFAIDAEHIAAFHYSRQRDVFKLAKFRERLGERGRFETPRSSSERHNNSEFIENDRGVFHKHGIGKVWLCRQRDDAGAKSCEKIFVGVMLLLGYGKVNRIAIDKRQFAIQDGRTDGARDGGEHIRAGSLHENATPSADVWLTHFLKNINIGDSLKSYPGGAAAKAQSQAARLEKGDESGPEICWRDVRNPQARDARAEQHAGED